MVQAELLEYENTLGITMQSLVEDLADQGDDIRAVETQPGLDLVYVKKLSVLFIGAKQVAIEAFPKTVRESCLETSSIHLLLSDSFLLCILVARWARYVFAFASCLSQISQKKGGGLLSSDML